MKIITLLVSIVFAFVSCNCQKKAVQQTTSVTKENIINQDISIPKFEYVANTRGFYQRIIIENQEVFVSNDRNDDSKGVAKKISDIDWNELKESFKLLKLDDLSTYKDPTQKRFYDGAAIANLKIIVGEKVYETTSFDHEIPPIEIEKLVNKIVSLGKNDY